MAIKAPVVVLYGIGGTYNHGCEAIIRGTVKILRSIWPDITIRYVTPMPEYDNIRLADTGVHILSRVQHARLSLPRLTAALLRRCGVPGRFQPFHENISWLDDCDMLFSIGGDMYTLSAAHHLAHLAEIAQKKRKKIIIWGASIGPLPDGDHARLLRHFRKADLITCREPETRKFLAQNSLDADVVDVADPAFAVALDDFPRATQKNRVRFGVNLSPLTAGDRDPDSVMLLQAEVLTGLVARYNADVLLIPHVVSDTDVSDDDLRYLNRLHASCPPETRKFVSVADTSGGYLAVKRPLRQCDLVIASRMHCAINAVSEGTPVIFAAYSNKAFGMCEYVYGNRNWIVDIGEIRSDVILPLVDQMLRSLETVRLYLSRRVEMMRADAFNANSRLKQLGQ